MANEPITREEILLNAVATGEATNLEPITREEMFLAKLGGADVNTPMPITRKEQFLQKAIENGGNTGGGGSAGGDEWFNDGDTHIWITLHEGRTSPMLGVCPNGTVTVDWGDGTAPDVLTGTSTSTVKWTPNHEYAKPGDYVIRLTVDGEMGLCGIASTNEHACILRHTSSADGRNVAYQTAMRKVEIGNGVTVEKDAFRDCYALSSVYIHDSVTSLGAQVFQNCYSLSSVYISNNITNFGRYLFSGCCALTSVTFPNSLTTVDSYAFHSCSALTSVTFQNSATTIKTSAFIGMKSVRFFDFTKHTAVPTLSSSSAFENLSVDYEIRVPAALYDKRIAATKWSTYASKIVAV